ncbi:WD40 repeat-like protein [Clavulina sp. PMI_390]|nr:WD40 repeat-like protein [Clavulina sp. PMI_390]
MAKIGDPGDTILDSPPDDAITSLHFNPQSSNQLLVSSWDSLVRLYEIDSANVKSTIRHRAAVLSCAFDPDPRYGYSVGLDSWVRRMDLDTERVVVLGAHETAASSVLYSHSTNQVITGSWDRTVKLWDPRKGNPKSLISSHEQPERVYSMDIVEYNLVVAASSRVFIHYDIRKMDSPIEARPSPLKFTTSSVKVMPGSEGFAAGTVEGRVAIEYFDKSPEAQAHKYAFKCHRQTIPEGDLVYPINALAFHPVHKTMATAGSDGTVAVWDHRAKKRVKLYQRMPTAVSAVAFSSDGSKLAVGVSSMRDAVSDEQKRKLKERGDDPEVIAIVVKSVGDELKRKS